MGTKVYDNALDLITFSRASGGTALRKISYGSELVTNGTFDSDTSGWTDAAAPYTTINWDAGTIEITASGGTARANQGPITTVVGRTYTISVTCTQKTSDASSFVHIGTSAGGTQYKNNLTKNEAAGVVTNYTFTATSTDLYIQIGSAVDTATVNFDNISVKEVLFDQPDGTLTLFNHPNNIPRIDYAADGTVKGLLIEEARTNLVANSQFNGAAIGIVGSGGALPTGWGSGAFDTVEIVEIDTWRGSPRIRIKATKDNSGGGSPIYPRIELGTFTPAASTTYTYSIFGADGPDDNITSRDMLAPDGVSNFLAGDFQGSSEMAELVYTATTSPSATGSQLIRIAHTVAAGTIGVSDFYISMPQFERGSFPTSYIPTSGATATRSADIASIPVTDFGYNQKAGTVVVDYTEFHNYTASPYPRVLALTNGYSPREGLEILSFNNVGNAAGYVGGSSIFSFVGATSTKTAFSASENNFSASFAGGSVLTDTAGAMPSATLLELGKYSSAAFLNGHIKSIQYFPRRLSNAQLQELTS